MLQESAENAENAKLARFKASLKIEKALSYPSLRLTFWLYFKKHHYKRSMSAIIHHCELTEYICLEKKVGSFDSRLGPRPLSQPSSLVGLSRG